jgi:prepilin-type N-terminal cleavage/methylation domain-containing protein
MTVRANEAGYTLIEILVAITLFSVVSIGFYQVMIQTVRGSETTRTVANIAEESRLGFNRMLRDAREADSLDAADATSFTIWVDYNANGTRDYTSDEEVRYTYSSGAGTITLASLNAASNVLSSAVLMSGVEAVDATVDVFDFTSNRLEYDYNPVDGITTWEEIDTPPTGVVGVGDRDGTLDSAELTYLSNIQIRFNVRINNRATEFYGEAQLRNRRFSV